ERLMLLASVLAMVAALIGLYVSFYLNVASGASIVLVETLFFGIALLFGPRSGLLSSRLARQSRVAPSDSACPPATAGSSRRPRADAARRRAGPARPPAAPHAGGGGHTPGRARPGSPRAARAPRPSGHGR